MYWVYDEGLRVCRWAEEMIFGECPYDNCSELLWIPIAEKCPVYERHECEKCKRVIWTYHSRVDPHSYTEKDFYEDYTVNKKTKQVEPIKK